MDAAELCVVLADAPLLADGGMGTSLIARGAPVGACFEVLNREDAAAVEAVHRGFVVAGARLILTNTFGANRFRLDAHGLSNDVAVLNRAGVAIARRAGAQLVGGSMGPLGVRLAPYGRVAVEEALAAYREQAEALALGGADLLVIETQTDLREVEQAILGARAASADTAILASATFTRDDRTLLGETPAQVAARLLELGADAIGVNCGEGPAQVLRVIRAMKPYVGGRPLMARPNAGGPMEVGGRFVYPATPAYVAQHALACVAEGASILGGCCGTGPEHTAAMAGALRSRGV
nr:homocysteine S-methyltransferase family protein [Actinomycetota bacterium]